MTQKTDSEKEILNKEILELEKEKERLTEIRNLKDKRNELRYEVNSIKNSKKLSVCLFHFIVGIFRKIYNFFKSLYVRIVDR